MLTAEDFSGATFTALDSSGAETLLDLSSAVSEPLGSDHGEVLSVSLVTDYSSSMRDSDIDMMSELYTDLVTDLPVVYEAEVVVFSTEVVQQQTFTEDAELLQAAVAPSSEIERDLTALYDGMGTSLDHLGERTRPARLLVVATDGAENASETWTQSAVIEAIEEENVMVVMIGSLFSDLDEFKALTGDRGIYFYAVDYQDIRGDLDTWVESISESVAVELDGLPADAASVRVELDGIKSSVEL